VISLTILLTDRMLKVALIDGNTVSREELMMAFELLSEVPGGASCIQLTEHNVLM
jgi:hypothetical protein